jgi:hypothetical protein
MLKRFGLIWTACLMGVLLCTAPLARAQSESEDEADNSSSEVAAPVTNKAEARAAKYNTTAKTMIVQNDFRIDAKIVGNMDKKGLVSEGDLVFLNAGLDVVAPGMEGTIYRKEGKVKDRKTRELLGTQLRRVGTLVITDEISEKACTARIIMSDDAIANGDLVHMGK